MPDFGFREVLNPQVSGRLFARGAARANATRGLGFGESVLDVGLAPLRGVEGAAQDVYGLFDTLTGDMLPDWDERLLGESRTFAGGLVEGVANFAAGFVPVAGWLGKAGKFGKVLNVTRAAQVAAKEAGLLGKARMIAAGRGALAGAVADFTVFDGNEARLSNLVQEFPHLQNPVSEYLAASDDDPEAFGRLKSVLEGALLGGFVETFAMGLRALKAQREAARKGLSAKATARFIREKVPPEEIQRSLFERPEPKPAPGEPPAPKEAPVPEEPKRILEDLVVDEELVGRIDEAMRQSEELGLNPRLNPRQLSTADRLEQQLAPNDLNLGRFSGPTGPLRFGRALEHLVRSYGARELAELNPKGLDELAARSEGALLDLVHAHDSKEAMVASVRRDLDTLAEVNTRQQAWVLALRLAQDQGYKLTRAALEAPAGTEAVRMARAFESIQFFADIQAAVMGFQAEAGRGLRAWGLKVTSMASELPKDNPIFRSAIDEEAEGLLSSLGGPKRARKALEKILVVMEEHGAEGLGKLTRTTGGQFWNLANTAWLNMILSGPRTLSIGLLGPITVSLMRPLERIMGGALMRDSNAIRSAVRLVVGSVIGTKDALAASKKSLALRRNLVLPEHTIVDLPRQGRELEARAMLKAEMEGTRTPSVFHPEVLGVDPESFGGKLLKVIDYLLPLPSAVLGASDELVKGVGFRGAAYDELFEDGLRANLSGDELANFVESGMDRIVRQDQAYNVGQVYRDAAQQADGLGYTGKKRREFVNDYVVQNYDERLGEISQKGAKYANTLTGTAKLEKGTLSKSIQDVVVQHPWLRLAAVPFIRTPANLLAYAARRADPFGPARFVVGKVFPATLPAIENTKNAFLRDMLSGDPKRKADAVGRIALGYSMLGTFFYMASSNRVTGKGPDDPRRAAALRQAGWLPYSIRLGDRWISYERLDPYASIIGAAADLYEYAQWSDAGDQDMVETALASTVTALANQLTQKSYLTGLRNVIGVLFQPERRAELYFEQFAGNALAPSLFASGVEMAGDQHMREVRGLLDAARNRIPGISGTLEPRRNLLGEPIERTRRLGADELGEIMNVWMPVAYSEVSDDLVDRELAGLRHGFGAPATRRGGIDLLEHRSEAGQTAFDRWQELHGSATVGGRTLRQALRQLFRTPQYRRLPLQSTPDLDSPRIPLVENLIRRYRDRAFSQVLREYPGLRREYQRLGIIKRRRRTTTPGLAGAGAGRIPALVTPQALQNQEPR